MTELDRTAADAARDGGSRAALRSLSSATLAVGSAAAFLVLVTLLSFVPDGGTGDQLAERPPAPPADRPVDHPVDRLADRLDDRTSSWQLRGALQPPDAPPLARERMAQRSPS